MDLVPVVSTFLLILVAELGDKTQLSIISLSCSYKWKHVFAGAMLAFLAVDGISLAVGGTLLALVPMRYVQVGSGIVFLVFGIVPFPRKEKTRDTVDEKRNSTMPLFATFSLVALMELDDKTQILTITLAAETAPILVLAGMILAFTLLTGVAVFVGAKYVSRLPMKWIKIGTSILFIILGVISIISGTLNTRIF